MTENEYIPRLIAFEVTRNCMLKCKHCRAGVSGRQVNEELTFDRIKKILDSIAAAYKPIIILTGGDPMMRSDIYRIIEYGDSLGLHMVIAPCGDLLDADALKRLKSSGIRRMSFSLDGADEASHDDFRGVAGSFTQVMKAVNLASREGMDFQINTTVTKHNIDRLPDILELAMKLGAVSFHPFLLVPTGNARKMAHMELSPAQYEKTLRWIHEKSQTVPIHLKPTCAPHYYRIIRQLGGTTGQKGHPGPQAMNALTRGCLGGTSFGFISHRGAVQICGFLDLECGKLEDHNYNFPEIWESSPMLARLRKREGLTGKCGICEYGTVCGGCRARAFEVSGDYMADEPYCLYEPARDDNS